MLSPLFSERVSIVISITGKLLFYVYLHLVNGLFNHYHIKHSVDGETSESETFSSTYLDGFRRFTSTLNVCDT